MRHKTLANHDRITKELKADSADQREATHGDANTRSDREPVGPAKR